MTPVAVFAAVGLVLQLALWEIQRRTRNAATADLGWTILVAGGSVGAALVEEGALARRILVAGLVGIWALRLGAHLVRDRVRSRAPEDGRYRALRDQWGSAAERNFLWLYLLQIPVAALFVIPIGAAMRGGVLDGWAVAGVTLWFTAVVGEWVADRQLASFRAAPRNRGDICRIGLWRYSRHPNYFFEWLHWWAYVLIGHAQPLTFLGPAAMLVFLFRITGIPYTERQALRSRGDTYRAYQRTTSVFVPWPPRGPTR